MEPTLPEPLISLSPCTSPPTQRTYFQTSCPPFFLHTADDPGLSCALLCVSCALLCVPSHFI